MRSVLTNVLVALAAACALAASPARAVPDEEIRRVFDEFIVAQNAHDVDGVRKLLSDSPDFLWAFHGRAVRDRGAALDGLRELFKSRWRVEPDGSTYQTLGLDISTVEIFVRVSISSDAPVRVAQMNMVLVDTAQGWRILSIVVSDLPPPRAVPDKPPGTGPVATARADPVPHRRSLLRRPAGATTG